MTSLNRPVKRETGAIVKGRPLVVELHAGYLTLRAKGKRHTVTVDYRAVLDLGYRILARAAATEKQAARQRRLHAEGGLE